MTKYEFLRIQHQLNAHYANKHLDIDKALNRINADLNHLIHLNSKKQLQLIDYIDEIKQIREDISPDLDELISLYDDYIYELDILAFSQK